MHKLTPAALLLLAAPAVAGTPPDMLLVCEGGTVTSVAESETTATAFDNRGNQVYGRSQTSRPGEVPFAVQFEIEGGEARLKLPDKAYPVRDLSIDDRRITGKVRYDLLTSSRFEIDRRTGIMTSQNGFHGQCRKVDQDRQAF